MLLDAAGGCCLGCLGCLTGLGGVVRWWLGCELPPPECWTAGRRASELLMCEDVIYDDTRVDLTD